VKLYSVEGVPGTGKTTLATKLFLNLVQKSDICYETFRRNMAVDFIRRLSAIERPRLRWVTTTHGICFRLLATEFRYTRDDVATPKYWKDFCKKLGIPISAEDLRKLNPENGETITHIHEIGSVGAKIYAIYSNCVNMLIDIDEWQKLPAHMQPHVPPPYNTQIPFIIDRWLSFLEAKGMVDFPQMLYKTLELKLCPPTEVYISDEFQDKTPIQFQLFKLWSRNADTVLVCFDKNQAIYSFWGTNPRFCDEVRRKSKFRVLSPSWRLSEDAYSKATKLLRVSDQEVFKVECVGHTKLIEIDFSRIPDIINIYNDIMILARTNYHLASLAQYLNQLGVPFLGRFGWTDKQLSIYSFVWKYRNSKEPIYKSEFLEYLKSTKAYSGATLEFVKKSMKNKLAIKDINNYLPSSHKLVLNSSDPFRLTNLTDKGILKLTNAISRNTPPRSDIYLTTIHGAKGLEADTVIVFDGVTTKIQTSTMKNPEEFKNEHRVWYVALTRAKKYCFIVRRVPIRFNIPFLPNLGALHGS